MLTLQLFAKELRYESPYENETNQDIAIDSINKIRLKWTLLTGGALYVGTSVTLYNTWYRDFEQTNFHFHNDWNEWRNMDKVGHISSAYNQSIYTHRLLKWAGIDDKKALLYSSLSSALFQTTIEVMDGFSAEWGFSATDFGANIVGIGLFATQQSLWRDQRIKMKFSYTNQQYNNLRFDSFEGPHYVQYNGEPFESNFPERILKDYNGQTNWLSINLKSFFPNTQIPDWLNVAFGYGVDNIYGGYDNSNAFVCSEVTCYRRSDLLPRSSQFYISLDADLSRIETGSAFLNTLLDVINVLKMPFSALELSSLGEVKFRLIQF